MESDYKMGMAAMRNPNETQIYITEDFINDAENATGEALRIICSCCKYAA